LREELYFKWYQEKMKGMDWTCVVGGLMGLNIVYCVEEYYEKTTNRVYYATNNKGPKKQRGRKVTGNSRELLPTNLKFKYKRKTHYYINIPLCIPNLT